MVNYPNFRLDGSEDFDGGTVRTRTPVGWEEGSVTSKQLTCELYPIIVIALAIYTVQIKDIACLVYPWVISIVIRLQAIRDSQSHFAELMVNPI